jgi:hypothetical protein
MATYRVLPLPDGVSQRYGWQVQKNGRRISKHTKKSAAKRTARSKKSRGDSLIVHGKNGQVLG